MSSVLKVDQIQSDTGVMNLSSGLVYVDQNNRRVGIGNTSPSQILEVTDTAPRLNFISTNNDSGARYNTDGTATNSHRWQYQGVTQMGLTSGGTLDLPYGQIKFPASQNASSDANTLDDYEEGTYIPTITTATGSITLLGGSDILFYRKIGGLVFISGRLDIASVNSPTGFIQITLPYSALNTGSNFPGVAFVTSAVNLNVNEFCVIGGSIGGAATARIFKIDGTSISSANANAQEIQAGTNLYLGFFYHTS